jgi:DNA-binding response OmpR family regulator
VLSKGQISERLLGIDEPLSPNAIEVHVSRLRTKIESAGVLIRTVRGFGTCGRARMSDDARAADTTASAGSC